ncbi:MAG TPA: ABC transporter ATP-binding protein [Acidimicrobiales bacterium]|nr:ABC transporter ATP-binding protein [Acidimicrobiales bacterium]
MTAGLSAAVGARVGELRLDVALDALPGEVVAVVGPNGAGKSSLLRALAGLVPLCAGRVVMGDTVLEDAATGHRLAPERRPVGVAFQDRLLFPHLSALDNVAFGLRCRGVRRAEARRRAAEWLDRLGVGHRAVSRPATLSGGEAQRVALARALAVEPALLLLDEPLSALDVEARAALRRELRPLMAGAGVAVLVTHDPLEAMTLAGRLVVLEHGRVVQHGTPREVAERPRSPWVAELVGVNLLAGQGRDGGVELAEGGWLAAPGAGRGQVLAVVHPRAVAVHRRPPEGSPRNVWTGRAEAVELLGDRARVRVALDGRPPLVAEVTPAAVTDLALDDGGEVWVTVKATEVRVFPA